MSKKMKLTVTAYIEYDAEDYEGASYEEAVKVQQSYFDEGIANLEDFLGCVEKIEVSEV